MPKMKSHRGAAKRFKSTATGKFKRGKAYKSHILNKKTTKLPAGQYLQLPTDRAWEIKFDRGQGFGVARYGLVDGPYQFTYTKQGWELVKKSQ